MIFKWCIQGFVFLQSMFSEILIQFCLANNRMFYTANEDENLKNDIYYQGFLIDFTELVSVYNSVGRNYYICLLLIDAS